MEEGELEDVGEEGEWLADDNEDETMSSDDAEDAYDLSNDVDMSARQRSFATELSVSSI